MTPNSSADIEKGNEIPADADYNESDTITTPESIKINGNNVETAVIGGTDQNGTMPSKSPDMVDYQSPQMPLIEERLDLILSLQKQNHRRIKILIFLVLISIIGTAACIGFLMFYSETDYSIIPSLKNQQNKAPEAIMTPMPSRTSDEKETYQPTPKPSAAPVDPLPTKPPRSSDDRVPPRRTENPIPSQSIAPTMPITSSPTLSPTKYTPSKPSSSPLVSPSPTPTGIKTNAPTSSSTPAPVQPTRYIQVRNKVEPLSGALALDSPTSPQNKALNWIVFDDEKQLDPSSDVLVQRYALSVIYYSTQGENSWTQHDNWLETGDECNWYGVICADVGVETNMVTELKLDRNNVGGILPAEIGGLEHVRNIELWRNEIGGSIPDSIGMLSSLRSFYFDDNKLTGTIPATIGNLVALEDIALYGNVLSGSLPAEIGKLTSLTRLWISGNKLSSNIPNEIGGMTSLSAFYLEGNDFTGSIPGSLGNLKSLTDFRASQNMLTGSLPSEMSDLSNLQLLYLDQNALSGSIPSWIHQMTSLVDLQLYRNDFSGSLPAEIGLCKKMQVFHIADNEISGQIPSEIGDMENLMYLYLHSNSFTGSVPSEVGRLQKLKKATFEGNSFNGAVPDGLCSLGGLDALSADCGGSNPSVQCSCCTSCF